MKLAELAVRFGCELRGDPDIEIVAVAPLSAATPGSISFLANPRYRPQLRETRAAAVIVDAASAAGSPVPVLVAANPHACFARVAALLHPEPAAPAGIDPSAIVAPDARIDPAAHVGPLCVIGAGVQVGPRSVLGPGCIVEAGAVLGADVRLVARVTVCRGVRLGDRCIVQPGAVLGADGFGYAAERGTWVKVPQVGSVRIGADVEIGANTTIDRGAIGDTVIEDGVKLDNLVQIGHNVRVGAHSAFAGCVGVAGSARIGRHCTAGGGAIILGHLELVDHVHVTAATVITRSILKPGQYSGLFPFDDNAAWEKNAATLRQLHGLRERLRALEKKT